MDKEVRWLTDEEIDNPVFRDWRQQSAKEWFRIYDWRKASELNLSVIVYDPWIWSEFCAWKEGKTPEEFAKEYKDQNL